MKKRLDELLLATEDVGSMPLLDDFDEGRKNVDQAITDKVKVGLDYPCYPQLVGRPSKPMDMGLQFLLPLSKVNPGIHIDPHRGQAHLISDEIKEPSAVIGVERAEYYMGLLRDSGLIEKLRGVKACVTGPFTLASYLDSHNMLTCGASKMNVVRALARILSRSCGRLSDLGFDLINVDEPFLSLILGKDKTLYRYDGQFVLEMLNTLINEIKCFSAIHVCGAVTPMVKSVLLSSEADIVDHEFVGCSRNDQAYSKDDLEKTNKFLAYGCVSSVTPQVETVKEISASLHKALKLYGPRVIVKPDCGFGGMHGTLGAYETVLAKLKNMIEASRVVLSEMRTNS
jgi:methionine synthase II (cobalamin-independent)